MEQQLSKRLQVMLAINHPESYYQQAAKSQGIDYTTLTHAQICVFVASMKAGEADILIHISDHLPMATPEEIDKFVEEYLSIQNNAKAVQQN